MDKRVLDKIETFFSQFSLQKYKKGDLLILGGEAPSGIFYLKKGSVRQHSVSKDGGDQTLTIYKSGSFFPMMWAINNTPNSHYFEAMTECYVTKAPREKVIAFLKNEPEVTYDLLSRMYSGLSGLLSRIEYLMYGNAASKIIFTLLNFSYRFGEKSDVAINLRITHREIAAYTGLTRETISREIGKLKKKGLVENTNNLVIIKNRSLLEDQLFAIS